MRELLDKTRQGSREKGEGISFPEKANRDFLCDYGNAKNLASNLKGSKSYQVRAFELK